MAGSQNNANYSQIAPKSIVASQVNPITRRESA